MRILLWLILGAVIIGGVAAFFAWLPLPAGLQETGEVLGLALTAFLGLVYLAGMGVLAVRAFGRPGKLMDAALDGLGLERDPALPFGRAYAGQYAGRAITITFQVGRYGYNAFYVTMSAHTGLRAALGMQRPLLDCQDCPALIPPPPALHGLHAYTREADRLTALLRHAQASEALRTLGDGAGPLRLWQLYLQPERLWLHASLSAFTAEGLRRVLSALDQLAQCAEQNAAEVSAGSRWSFP